MRRYLQAAILLLAADGMAVLVALLLGLVLRQHVLPATSGLFRTQAEWQNEYLAFLVFATVALAYEGLYTRRRVGWEEFRSIVRGISVAMVLFLAAMTVVKRGEEVSRPALVLAWGLAPCLIAFLRLRFKRGWLHKRPFWVRRLLILGRSAEGGELVSRLRMFPELGYQIVGFLADDGGSLGEGGSEVERLGALSDYEEVISAESIDEVIIAMPGQSRVRQFELLKAVEQLVPRVHVLPELFDVDKLNVDIESIERHFLLCFNNNLMKRSNRALKNVFEILIVLFSLPMWAPLLVLLSILVKISSPGPVLFRQRRVGSGGRPFWCYKFRTMALGSVDRLQEHLASDPTARAEWEAEHKLRNDPRVTRVGRFLRKTSLDELPQLFNILKGEMSLVGPRPIVDDEIVKYGDYFGYYKAVCPGLSGLWQVSGRNDTGYDERVMLDVFYVRNWSLWLDFTILLKTVPAVLGRGGAY